MGSGSGPTTTDNLQGDGQVPVVVDKDAAAAQEGEADLPDLLKELEGPENREEEQASEVGRPGRNLPSHSPYLHIRASARQRLVNVAFGRRGSGPWSWGQTIWG